MEKKKWWSAILAILLAVLMVTFVGCTDTQDSGAGIGSNSGDTPQESASTEEKPKETHWGDDGELKILMIGNSFSCDTIHWMYGIAKNVGVEKLLLGNLDSLGFSLSNHLIHAKENAPKHYYHTNSNGMWSVQENYLLTDAVSAQNLDFISFQQSSGSSGQPYSYDVLPELMDFVRELCPSAKFVWNMTWAYQVDSTHSAFSNYRNDQAYMYKAITRTVQAKVLPNKDVSLIVPNATSIQNARTSYLGDTLTRDGYHLSYDIGRYIAGVTFFHAVTGIDVSALTYAPDGVDDNVRKVAIESAINAVKTPYEITPSQYVGSSQTI